MAEIEASKEVTGAETVDLDETRSYTIYVKTGGNMAVDGGDPVELQNGPPAIVVGPGVGKLVFSGTPDLWIIPRSDSRL